MTPASADFFDECVSSEPLPLDCTEVFHSIVQKLLYICKRARPDLEPALSLLCTRVSKPNADDEKKLARVLDYLKDTVDDIRTKKNKGELVAVSDYIPYHIWIIIFLKSQGYNIKEKVLYQDNQSAMKMEVHGRNSCTGNSRDINIRYFFGP